MHPHLWIRQADRRYPIPRSALSLEVSFAPGPVAIPEYATRACKQAFVLQLSRELPDALVIRNREEVYNGIELFINPTKLSPYYPLLYKDAVMAMRMLSSHRITESLYYEMAFSLYHTISAGRMRQMDGRLGEYERSDHTM